MGKTLRNILITVFVIFGTILFHYESVRYFYLLPRFGESLPKCPLLFPPAGWIMFYNVDDTYGDVDVYGVKGNNLQLIDAHDIFRTRTIGFDNIHRNVLSSVADPALKKPFCGFLKKRFPYFDRFVVMVNYYPSVTKEPNKVLKEIRYQCAENP